MNYHTPFILVVALILAKPTSAQNEFAESFNGGGPFESVQKRDDFTGQLFGQVLSGLDEPNWFFGHDGVLQEGGYRYRVNPQEPDGGGDFFESAGISRDIETEAQGSFVERIKISNLVLEDGPGNSSAGIFFRHFVDDKPVSRIQVGLFEIVDPMFGSDGKLDIRMFVGDFFAEDTVDPGDSIGIELIFYDFDQPLTEFTYDNDINDSLPAQRFGPFVYSASIGATQSTEMQMRASSKRSVSAGVLDHWSMQELSDFRRGDFDFNGMLDANDIEILSSDVRIDTDFPVRDTNGDGIVNADDRLNWVHHLKNTFFGDANLDGEFNSTDLIAVFEASEYEDGIEHNSNWLSGDWNGDAEFGSGDLVFAFQDGGYELGPRIVTKSVPEATSSSAMLLLVVTIFSGRLRFRSIGWPSKFSS